MLKSELFSTRLSSFSPRARTLSMVLCCVTKQTIQFRETETSIIFISEGFLLVLRLQKKLKSLTEHLFGESIYAYLVTLSACLPELREESIQVYLQGSTRKDMRLDLQE